MKKPIRVIVPPQNGKFTVTLSTLWSEEMGGFYDESFA
jgi:hypothetical protein